MSSFVLPLEMEWVGTIEHLAFLVCVILKLTVLSSRREVPVDLNRPHYLIMSFFSSEDSVFLKQ